MKKYALLFALSLGASCLTQAQLKFSSKDHASDGKPLYEFEFSPRLKLNGYVNLGGNAAGSQSVNINSADPYNNLTTKDADINMYQTQLAFKAIYNGFAKGPLVTYVEGHWWGGPGGGGNLQLRRAFVDYNHWHVGQDWTFFGAGVASWYNTLDWESANSGTWARHVQVKYYTDFGKNNSWKFEGGMETSAPNLKVAAPGDANMPGQFSVDPIVAVTKYTKQGFVRLAAMGRSLRYAKDAKTNALSMGWGVNANYKTKIDDKSYIMLQGLAGAGVAGSYTMSGEFFGAGTTNKSANMYDGIYDQDGKFKTVPVVGGSAGVEYFFGARKRLHSNLVLGYTNLTYNSSPIALVANGVVKDNGAGDFVTKCTDSKTTIGLTYASLNAMYDITKNFTAGVEYNYGLKSIVNSTTQSSSVNRIALGVMVGF